MSDQRKQWNPDKEPPPPAPFEEGPDPELLEQLQHRDQLAPRPKPERM